MTVLFLVSLAVVVYAYLGYPALLRLLPEKPLQINPDLPLPSVSVLMCVRDEEKQIRQKLENLSLLEYPKDSLEVVVVSDGSTDGTAAVVRSFQSAVNLRLLELREHVGKAASLDRGLAIASGEIIFFVDVRQVIEPGALRSLVEALKDERVGVVSGELKFRDEADPTKPTAVGLYWKYEKLVRKLESRTGAVVGATGAIYAARRNIVQSPPAGLLLDDVFIPMHAAKAGYRVIFDPGAIAWDNIATDHRYEFRRKVRTLYGNLQMLEFAPWLLSFSNPLWFRFVSHKLCRLIVPFALVGMTCAAFFGKGLAFNLVVAAELTGLAMAMFGETIRFPRLLNRLGKACRTFVLLNLAAALALIRFLIHVPVDWEASASLRKRQQQLR